jgi:1-aminocyclopropane-1-carboxylate deaminase/D-cysteine desulfhydrase-like pyridoxal-dependent ACC family enzyme
MDLPYEPGPTPDPEGVTPYKAQGAPTLGAVTASRYDPARVAIGSLLASSLGNPQLDRLFGIDLRHHPDGPWEDLYSLAEDLSREYEAGGAKVYRVPVGGSSPLGAYAFYRAAEEIQDAFDWIVTASSSGSTQTGLVYAFDGSKTRILGIASDPEPELVNDFASLGEELAKLIDPPRIFDPSDFLLNTDFVGPGYGIPSDAGRAAIEYLARTEGILLDPIYTGKAFAGLMSLVERGDLKGRILFWHTGGVPSLFALT